MDNPYLKLDAIFERVKSATRKGGYFFMNIDTEIQKDFAPPKYPPQLTDLSHIIEIGVCERRN